MMCSDSMTFVLDRPDDEVGGVGGADGIKMEGIQAIVAMIETMRTICGMEPRKGLMSCAS